MKWFIKNMGVLFLLLVLIPLVLGIDWGVFDVDNPTIPFLTVNDSGDTYVYNNLILFGNGFFNGYLNVTGNADFDSDVELGTDADLDITDGYLIVANAGHNCDQITEKDGDVCVEDAMQVDGKVYFPGLGSGDGDASVCYNTTTGELTQGSCGGKTPRLTDFVTNETEKILVNMLNSEGVYKYVLKNRSFDSEFVFKISNVDPEREYFDMITLGVRCHVGHTMYVVDNYPLIYSSIDMGLVSKSDDVYMELEQGDENIIMFKQPEEKVGSGCDWVDFIIDFEGFYERTENYYD